MNDRQATLQSILQKIKALRARAEDSASSENEAAMAAKVADELLAKHNIKLSEVDVRADGIVRKYWDSGRETCPVETWSMIGIDKGCNTDSWYCGGVITVVGSPADVETALYYIDLARAAVANCWKTFQQTDEFFRQRERGLTARKIGFSFRKGVAVRLGQRIGKFAETEDRVASSANALVPVKNAMIEQWKIDNDIKLAAASKPSPVSGSAYMAGQRAAESVGLGRGVTASRPVAMIEGN